MLFLRVHCRSHITGSQEQQGRYKRKATPYLPGRFPKRSISNPMLLKIHSSATRAAKTLAQIYVLASDESCRAALVMFSLPNYTPDRLFGTLAMSTGVAVTACRCAMLMATARPSNNSTRVAHGSTGTAHNAAPTVTNGTR